MTNYRKIFRLNSLGYSKRSIESSVRNSHQKVNAVLERAKELDIAWPIRDDITNEILNETFVGSCKNVMIPYAVIDYDYIHRELSRKGMTLTLFWQEYCERTYANGEQTVGNDYLISDGVNKYSVPLEPIGEQVKIRVTKNLIEVYFKNSCITSHKRLTELSVKLIFKDEHMPDHHRTYLRYNADEFKTWAKFVSKFTEKI